MFHPLDLQPPPKSVCKSPENPFESKGPYVHRILQQCQGDQGDVYTPSISGIGSVLIKELKPHLVLQGLDDVVELEVALKQDGAPVVELLSHHEWNVGFTLHAIFDRFYSGGDLLSQICRLHKSKAICAQCTELIARSLVKMMRDCLAHLHQIGWVHVDIRPENILFSDKIESSHCQAYSGDFGSTALVGTQISPLTSWTPVYFPKQVFRNCFGPAQFSLDLNFVGKVLTQFYPCVHKLPLHVQSVMQGLLAQDAALVPTATKKLVQDANRARSRSPSSRPQQELPVVAFSQPQQNLPVVAALQPQQKLRAVDADCHVDPSVHQIDRYENLVLIGKGTFGCVFKGWDSKYQREVALKVVRRIPKYFQDAKIEALTITRLQTELGSQDYCVIIYRYLEWNEHFCIAFEKLHSTLHSYIYDMKRRVIGCKRNVIQHVIFRLLRCVSYLHSVRIAHVDIKPENIMFIEDPRTSGNYQVKLIDFGAATWLTTHHSSLIQTRFYRAPEVIIESKWDEKADLWSVGCIMLEMYFGRRVFETHDSLEHLHLIEKFCGRIPQSLLQRSPDSCVLVERVLERCIMNPDESIRRISELHKKRQYFLGFQSLK